MQLKAGASYYKFTEWQMNAKRVMDREKEKLKEKKRRG